MSDLEATLRFINGATRDDLDRLHTAIRARDRVLRATAAAEVAATISIGAKVRTDGLSPKYLNGLTGTVDSIKGQRADIALNTPSTYLIVGTRHGPYTRPAPDETFVLRGVPLSTLKVEGT